MLDWIRLLEDNHIYFVTAGPNTGRGEVSINCPFCAGNDPSQHLGIHLYTGKWNCWRDSKHRGQSPDRLVGALLGLSAAAVKHTIQAYTGAAHDEFDTLSTPETRPNAKIEPVRLPPEFDPIEANTLTHKFWQHIKNRGFDDPDKVISEYHLKGCLSGRWKGRLIIPIFGKKGL